MSQDKLNKKNGDSPNCIFKMLGYVNKSFKMQKMQKSWSWMIYGF